MVMTDSQFKGFVRFVLDDIKEVLENMPDSKEKEKLQKEEGSTSVKGDSDQELAQLQDRLAKRLGVQQEQIILRWKGA